MTEWTHVDDLFVDGRWTPVLGTDRLEVTDPARGDVWGSVPQANPADLDVVVGAARAAFDTGPWPRMRAADRAEILLRAADEIEKRSAEISTTVTRENGSPIAETSGAAANAAGLFRAVAGLAEHLDREDVRPFPSGDNETLVRRDPVGVCALIAPWNFPINLVAVKLAPALLAGCTAVIKPAESTPLSIRHVVEALDAAGVPPGVVGLVTGDGAVGDALVRHPGVDKVAFTGSTGVGRKIAAACGELLRPVTLELGGKSAAIVLDDADLDHLASVLIRSCMRNTGQTCYISTRVLAPRSRYEEIVDVIARTISVAPVGDPTDPGTVFGPLASERQRDIVAGYLESARAEGARVVVGGSVLDERPGSFVEPTVLADVTESMTVARDEVFGPVLVVMLYEDVDDAIRIANATPFGLGGIVFGTDTTRAQEVAERIDTGSVGINFFASNHVAPFGGRHDSGLGVEYGVEGLEQYVTFKSIHRRRIG
ncbi:MAG: aldehyde dehydrogenase family protein [Williamsia herbipolensis]|nr:aldehyde dehydrogenase family protein [Williamsia herbipolensis]